MSVGRGVRAPCRRWRCGVGSCWRARRAATTLRSAERLGVGRGTVGKWRRRFIDRRLDGLDDEPRPGAPRSIGDDDVERVIVKTLEEMPVNATHWSTRSLAASTGMTQSAVSRIWRAFGLKPHLVDSFKLSLVPVVHRQGSRRCRVVSKPPDAAVVLCVDEKSQIQVLDRTAPALPLLPGTPERRTHHYKRNGTTNLYAALDVASGQVIADLTPRHCAEEFRRFLNLIDNNVPEHLDVHVIVDNNATHKTPSIQRWVVRHPRFALHFTPTYSSWLNLVERRFVELTQKWLKRGTHHSTRQLVASIRTLYFNNGTTNPNPSSGTRPPTRSSTTSPTTARISDSVTRRGRLEQAEGNRVGQCLPDRLDDVLAHADGRPRARRRRSSRAARGSRRRCPSRCRGCAPCSR